MVTSFLRRGLELGEKVIYIAEERIVETILGYLREEGLAVEPYLEAGQLGILTANQAYMREEAFDPEKMIALLREETARALEKGYPALRVTGEMTWALRGLSGSERLIEYEAKLNEFLPGSRCLAICQYDRRRFEPGLLLDVLTTHPTVVIGTKVYEKFYYLPPKDFLGPEPEKVKLESWIHNLAERRQAEEERQKSQAKLQSIIEKSADGIVIVDHEGMARFVNPSAELLFAKEAGELVGQMFGLPVVAGEATEIEIVSGEDILTAEMRVVEMEWEGKPAYLAALRDITSRKRIENELRASEEKFRMLGNNLPGIVF